MNKGLPTRRFGVKTPQDLLNADFMLELISSQVI